MRTKIYPLGEVVLRTATHRSCGAYIIHCHGCFDLLHLGHVEYLQEARELGNYFGFVILVVTVTADQYVQKGPGRPFFTQDLRAKSLAALECVDYVAINDAPTACGAIEKLKPDWFVKGPECRTSNSVELAQEEQAVIGCGGRMVFTKGMVLSSTELLVKAGLLNA